MVHRVIPAEDLLREARIVLGECVGPNGLAAASLQSKAYKEVWGRDLAFSVLLAADSMDRSFAECAWTSQCALLDAPSTTGMVPNNIDVFTGAVDTWCNGSVDASLFPPVVLDRLITLHPDMAARLPAYWDRLQRAYAWARGLDINGDGLIETASCVDWSDFYSNRGTTLYICVIEVLANRALARLAIRLGHDPSPFSARAADLVLRINARLRVLPPQHRAAESVTPPLKFWNVERNHHHGTFVTLPHYLAWVDYRDQSYYFETLGNALAILAGVAEPDFADQILDYGEVAGIDVPCPCRAVDPVAYPGGPDWRDLYHRFALNRPHHYINGGGWPFIGGIWIQALVRRGRVRTAQRVFDGLVTALAVPRGEDPRIDFPEWIHGQSGRPGGISRQAWSAAAFLGAAATIAQGHSAWDQYAAAVDPQPAHRPA